MNEELEKELTVNDELETALTEFTGAKGAVLVDNIAHAIELGLRYSTPKMYATIPENAPVDVLMTMAILGIDHLFDDEDKWDKYYRINGSIVYDCRRHFEKDMFQTDNPNQRRIMCVEFGKNSPLIGSGYGAAILTNDRKAHDYFVRAVNGGRNPKVIDIGFQYQMRPEDAAAALEALNERAINSTGGEFYKEYSSLRKININTEE